MVLLKPTTRFLRWDSPFTKVRGFDSFHWEIGRTLHQARHPGRRLATGQFGRTTSTRSIAGPHRLTCGAKELDVIQLGLRWAGRAAEDSRGANAQKEYAIVTGVTAAPRIRHFPLGKVTFQFIHEPTLPHRVHRKS